MKNPADWIKDIDPNKMMDGAQDILGTAVKVLEEEIAAGILAAKKISQKVIDVEKIQSDPEDLINQVRENIHEAVDLFLDGITSITNHISKLANTVPTEKQNATQEPKPKVDVEKNIVVVQNDGFAIPGSTVELPVELNNDSEKAIKVTLKKPTLLGPKDQKILSKQITIQPITFTIEPGTTKEVSLSVKIPKVCKSGTYSGLLCDASNIYLRSIINVNVA